MTTLEPQFAPLQEFEESPGRIDGVEGVETPSRVDLRELPLGTIIEFFGSHPDSKYITLLCGSESHRQIKIWQKGKGNGAIASIDCLFSRDFENLSLEPQLGFLEIGKNYFLPDFHYDQDGQVFVQQVPRTEPYTRIFIKRPSK